MPGSDEHDSHPLGSAPEPSSSLDSLWALVPRWASTARRLGRHVRSSSREWVSERLDAIDERFVDEGARSVTATDVRTVVEEADAIEDRFRDHGPLRRVMKDGRLLLQLVQDAYDGRYRVVPAWSLSAVVFTLLYVLNPFDLIPEVLPVLGVLDDAAVVSVCLVLVEQDLHEYREWRRSFEERSAPSPGSERLPAPSGSE